MSAKFGPYGNKPWTEAFNDCLSCQEVYNLTEYIEELKTAISDLKECHPEVTNDQIRKYLSTYYPNQSITTF